MDRLCPFTLKFLQIIKFKRTFKASVQSEFLLWMAAEFQVVCPIPTFCRSEHRSYYERHCAIKRVASLCPYVREYVLDPFKRSPYRLLRIKVQSTGKIYVYNGSEVSQSSAFKKPSSPTLPIKPYPLYTMQFKIFTALFFATACRFFEHFFS